MVVINVVLDYILIIEVGVIGVAISTALVHFVGLLIMARQINISLKCQLKDYFNVHIYIKIFFLSIILCALVNEILAYISFDLWNIIPLSIGFYTVIQVLSHKFILPMNLVVDKILKRSTISNG
jgi:Na+-driven multidrug efflux pump